MARSHWEGFLAELWSGVEFIDAFGATPEDGLPLGDGSGVLLIPGLWGDDGSLLILRRYLTDLGYDARTWRLGINNQCGEETILRLIERADRHRERHRRPLAVIGHSRGGFMARELARRAPDLIDLVITLGTPVGRASLADQSWLLQAMVAVSRALFAKRPGCLSERCDCQYIRNLRSSRPLPAGVIGYSLYSRDDGIVRPEDCVTPGERDVEVSGTHIGMVANREVLKVIAQILAQQRIARAAQAS